MRILALEPYLGGSHQAFLEGWQRHSRHAWTVLGLPAYKWKWRMRHSALTLSNQVAKRLGKGHTWDAMFASDMLPLAEFRGLVDSRVANLPTVFYFHENQLTYPDNCAGERDHHFAFTNFVSAAAADAVWFNSEFHRSEFLAAIKSLLRRMPDYIPKSQLDRLADISTVQPPGVILSTPRKPRVRGPLHILWCARWEHDKGPEDFFLALRRLAKTHAFRLSVLGESFENQPEVFGMARQEFAEHIVNWGYIADLDRFRSAVAEADVVVSTAKHEFFGMAIAEAAAAGVIPVVPRRLAYPEIFGTRDPQDQWFFYDGTTSGLVKSLQDWADVAMTKSLETYSQRAQRLMKRFDWTVRAAELDDLIPSGQRIFPESS